MTVRESTLIFGQDQFDSFARLSGDNNPIHVDPAFSAETKFGRTVAHGMMLFAFLNAELARLRGPFELRGQELSFRAPTFVGEQVILRLEERTGRIHQTITKADGAEAAVGWATTEPGFMLPAIAPDSATYRGLRSGMAASERRVFSSVDLAGYVTLTGDPNPGFSAGIVPPALLGGMISSLLGVELPGRGTNWLRQRFIFHRSVAVGAEVEAEVRVARLRPSKGLVDLHTTCAVDGEEVVTGQALVWATDVGPR